MSKILISSKFFHPVVGGVETVALQTALALSSSGNSVTVICAKNSLNLTTSVEYYKGIKIIRCSSLGVYFSMPVSISFIFYLFSLLRKFDYILVHEPFPLASLILGLFPTSKIKIFVFWHSEIIKQKLLRKLFSPFYRRMLLKSYKVFYTYPNQLKYSYFFKEFSDLSSIHVPLGVPSTYISSMPIFNAIQIPSKYALYIGRFSYYKGLEVLADSIQDLDPSVQILIIGSGSLSENAKKIFADDDRIVFIEQFVSNNEKNWLIDNAYFLIFPSIAESEAFGIIQVEALRSGTPIINTSLKSGVPWVSIDDITGITIEPNNSIQLSDAINKLWLDEQLVQQYSLNCINRYDSLFNEKDMFLKISKSFEESDNLLR